MKLLLWLKQEFNLRCGHIGFRHRGCVVSNLNPMTVKWLTGTYGIDCHQIALGDRLRGEKYWIWEAFTHPDLSQVRAAVLFVSWSTSIDATWQLSYRKWLHGGVFEGLATRCQDPYCNFKDDTL